MAEKLPTRAHVEMTPFKLQDGLWGILDALQHIIHLQAAPEAAAISLDESLLISGAAFCHYAPDLKPDEAARAAHQPEVDPAWWLSEFVCNWGAFESLSYYSAWDFSELSSLKRLDIWRLIQFEIAHGRPVLILREDPRLSPALINGYEFHLNMQARQLDGALSLLSPGSAEFVSVDLESLADFKKLDIGMTNWLLIARPAEQVEWAPGRHLQRARLLAWVVDHARRYREFSQEFNRHFGAGLRAFDTLQAMTSSDALGAGEPGEDFQQWLGAHLAQLEVRRRAAARQLRVWADEFGELSELSSDARDTARGALNTAAQAYQAVADALKDAAELSQACAKIRAARSAEARAIDALESAVSVLPR